MPDEILGQASDPVDGAQKELGFKRWLLWPTWVVVSALGFLLAGSLCSLSLGYLAPEDWPWVATLGLVWLGLVALWLGLWRRHLGTGWWLMVMPVGLIAAGSAAQLPTGLYIEVDSSTDWYLMLAIAFIFGALLSVPAGFISGLFHWLALRRQADGARRSMKAIAKAFVAGHLVVTLPLAVVFVEPEIPPVLDLLVVAFSLGAGGAIYGAISGRSVLKLIIPDGLGARQTKA